MTKPKAEKGREIKMKIIKITESLIKFDNGTEITFSHDQDCCEQVYADFNSLKDQDIKKKTFKEIKIRGVRGSGFRLNEYFIPCYNEQNGYYSSKYSDLPRPKLLKVEDFVRG